MWSYMIVYRLLKTNTVFFYFHRISLNKYLFFLYFHLVSMLLTNVYSCDLRSWCFYYGKGGGDGYLESTAFC